jgi:DNA-binding transcriptional ArsR family regulator
MKDETFMLLSMKDSKSVANAMSNETSQKIISYLAEKKEATESEIAKALKVPLPTVHYNIQQLKKAKLVDAKEFFWSKKGKEMLVYKLAKRYIIISPDNSETNLSKLKSLLPVTMLSVVGSGIVYLWQKSQMGLFRATEASSAISDAAKNTAQDAVGKLLPGAETMGKIAAPGTEPLTNLTTEVVSQTIEPNLALWFLSGSLFVILVFLLFSLFKKK